MLGIFLAIAIRFPLNYDVAWFMTMARRVLNGDKLYRDVIDVNPPLIIYMMMPPVVLSDLTGLSDTLSLQLLIVGGSFLSVLGFLKLLRTPDGEFPAMWWVVLLVLALLVVPAYDFGQREHLLVLLTLPYLAVKWRRWEDLPVAKLPAIVAGAAAGLGFAIKPHFLLIWLALEAIERINRPKSRRLRADRESVGVVVTLVAYAVFVTTVHSAYLSMMADIGPLYHGFSSASFRLLFITYYGVPLFVVLLAATVAPGTLRQRKVAFVFLAFGLAALVGAYLQGKGWRYHSLPSIIATVVAWGSLGQGAVHCLIFGHSRSERIKAAFAGGILLIATYPFYHGLVHAVRLADEQRVDFNQRVEDIARFEPGRILVLGDVVADAFPLINNVGARSASPYPSMWWLRSFYGAEVEGAALATIRERSSTETWLSGLLVASFLKDPPDLVLVDTAANHRFGGSAFPYLEYFSQDSAFASAWRDYRKVGAVGRFAVWRN